MVSYRSFSQAHYKHLWDTTTGEKLFGHTRPQTVTCRTTYVSSASIESRDTVKYIPRNVWSQLTSAGSILLRSSHAGPLFIPEVNTEVNRVLCGASLLVSS